MNDAQSQVVEIFTNTAQFELEMAHGKLHADVLELVEKLQRLAGRLQTEGVNAELRGLGIQSLANDVDRGCSALAAAREKLRYVKRALSAVGERA